MLCCGAYAAGNLHRSVKFLLNVFLFEVARKEEVLNKEYGALIDVIKMIYFIPESYVKFTAANDVVFVVHL